MWGGGGERNHTLYSAKENKRCVPDCGIFNSEPYCCLNTIAKDDLKWQVPSNLKRACLKGWWWIFLLQDGQWDSFTEDTYQSLGLGGRQKKDKEGKRIWCHIFNVVRVLSQGGALKQATSCSSPKNGIPNCAGSYLPVKQLPYCQHDDRSSRMKSHQIFHERVRIKSSQQQHFLKSNTLQRPPQHKSTASSGFWYEQ